VSKSPPQPKRGRCHLRWHSFNGLQRCAEPKNHNGACRAPRTGDRIRWKKLGLYEKDWPKDA
jgi:hypothetical protein